MIKSSASNRRLIRAIAGLLVIGSLLCSLGLGAIAAAAQATPATGGNQTDRIPCPVEPVTGDRFVAALDAATPQPLATLTLETVPVGEPADDATIDGVTATVVMALSCRNAGDFPRVYGLFSNRMIGQLFGGRETVPPEILEALQAPQRIRPALRVNLVDISAISLLPDGRVGAVVTTANATHTFTDFLYFVNEDGQWLIDEAIVIAASASPATPVP